MKTFSVLLLGFLLAYPSQGLFAETPNAPQPNILLIVADDLGYADLGVFGSTIRTPNIDRLAAEGMRFSQFHTAPMCAPTRAMLLSGNNNHIAGLARQHPGAPLKNDMSGYEGHLSDRIAPLPRVLRDAGYHTYKTGKWHLGTAEEHSPRAAGFDRSFGLVEGAASHYDGRGFENARSIYREDGELTEWPEGAYATEIYTDKLIDYVESNRQDGQPFFAFAAYTSPHWPLQVPDDELDRYAGDYDAGYDVLRESNFANLQKAGIVSPDHALPPRNEDITPWDDLSAEQRRRESRKMELYAAMVENLDHHIGRLVRYLKDNKLYDNTLIIFMSDNGAAGEDFYNQGPFVDYLRSHYDNRFENMGKADSFVSYDDAWAEAGSAPFKRFKTHASQGGIVAPMVISGHGVKGQNEISHSYLTVMDIAPTLIELAGASYPQATNIEPMRGSSMTALLRGETDRIHGDDHVTVLFHRNHALVRQGRWKLTAMEMPFDEAHFKLYDLANDPGETNDLSDTLPEKRAGLIDAWREERRSLGIVLPQDL